MSTEKTPGATEVSRHSLVLADGLSLTAAIIR